jgi:hypothetical protein
MENCPKLDDKNLSEKFSAEMEAHQLVSDLPFDCEVRGHGMCKEMPVIPVNRVVDKKRIVVKMEGPETILKFAPRGKL